MFLRLCSCKCFLIRDRFIIFMSQWPDSNWRPAVYDTAALPTELHWQCDCILGDFEQDINCCCRLVHHCCDGVSWLREAQEGLV